MARHRPPHAKPSAPAKPARSLEWLDPRAPYVIPALVLLVTRFWFAVVIPYAAEDAYITFRFARNFAHGLGPVFNPGEHVFGFTSAPWMAWTALGMLLGADPVPWTRVTLVIADLVTLAALGSLLERHASRRSAWCFGLFFAVWPYFPALAGTGLEMGAMLALISLSAWLVDRKHPLAGGAIGLLAAFRPEGLLAAGALAVWAGRRARLVALGVTAAFFAALTLYFGSPLPQSVVAKVVAYGMPGPLNARQWWDWAFPMPLDNGLASISEGANFFLIAVLVFPAAITGAIAVWEKRSTALAAAAAAALLVWLAYIGAGASYFFWYFATPLFAWVLLAAVGLPRLVNGPWAYVAALLAIAGHWTYEPNLYTGRAFAEASAFGPVGDFLAQRAKPGETVMLEPIGTIGWRAHAQRIEDEIGLVSREVSARRSQGPGWYTDIVAKRRPEWLVVRRALLQRGDAFAGLGAPFRSAEERFSALAAYDTAAVGDPSAGDDALFVLARRDRE